MSDLLQNMFEIQAAFQDEELRRYFPEGYETPSLHHSLCSHIISETQELMDCVPWMLHKPLGRGNATRKATVVEIVDVLKFLLNVALLHGVEPRELYEEFAEKSAVVEDRRRTKLFLEQEKGPILILDMDGVLVDRDPALLAFINAAIKSRTGHVFSDLLTAKRVLGQAEYERHKHAFYDGPGFVDCKPMEEALAELQLEPDGRSPAPILILTAREAKAHPGLHFTTMKWLKDNGIRYQGLIFSGEKARTLAELGVNQKSIFIDDDAKHAESVSNVCNSYQYRSSRDMREAVTRFKALRAEWLKGTRD